MHPDTQPVSFYLPAFPLPLHLRLRLQEVWGGVPPAALLSSSQVALLQEEGVEAFYLSQCTSPIAQALGSHSPRGCHWHSLQGGLWALAQVPVASPKWAVWLSHTGPQSLALSAGDKVPPLGSPDFMHFPFQDPLLKVPAPHVFEPNDQGLVVSPLSKIP